MYDPDFVHPLSELLHELYAQRTYAPDFYWPLEAERAYGQALIGDEHYPLDSHSRMCRLLQAEDAFTFNAVLYDMFVIASWPLGVWPALVDFADTYRQIEADIQAAKTGERWNWPAFRHGINEQRHIESLAWQALNAAWEQIRRAENHEPELVQLDMFDHGVPESEAV